MNNWFRGNDRSEEAQLAASPRLLKRWPIITAILLAFCGLFVIAAVIVLSIIPIYLSTKDTSSPAESNNNDKMIAIAFATDYTGNTSSGITNYAAVAQQINEYLGYSRNTLSVRLITFSGVGERKKRDTGSGISCNVNNGINYSTANGSAMGMSIIVNNCPRTRCVTNQCIQNCLAEIKSSLLSVFGSTHLSLTFQTTDGQTIKTSCRFCQFGSISSGSTCIDGVKNGFETDVDCGGAACVSQSKTCGTGLVCGSSRDCTSRVCTNGTCQAPTCTDGVKNGLETSADCGGAACVSQSKTCGTGLGCGSSTDCTSGVCTSGTCQAPTCTDGVKNGLETSVDCGGVTCVSQSKTCGTGLGCGSSTDCTSGVCTSGTCQAPTCTDGVKNGLETSVDCGGADCVSQSKTCDTGLGCGSSTDCTSGMCDSGTYQISLAAVNGIIQAVYNTFVGGDSTASTPGTGIGQYPPSQSPEAAWDNDRSTVYINFGSCTSSDNNNQCGLNTGFYLELQRGSTVVTAFQLYTGSDHSERDPLIVSLEGSNQSGSNLALGSSWTLIYNGNSGLATYPGPNSGGSIQQTDNTISYKSYRFLVSGKRSTSNSVLYSELIFYGY
ncbi:unnamed protein product [Adineta ricciae]|uniref:Uncharacterized protein n=1 Tax=Adineta ricciae TaxID=249248 RepID=A0A815QCK2_ADIRI|nr:unnamed protein product [Adineta ricciae]